MSGDVRDGHEISSRGSSGDGERASSSTSNEGFARTLPRSFDYAHLSAADDLHFTTPLEDSASSSNSPSYFGRRVASSPVYIPTSTPPPRRPIPLRTSTFQRVASGLRRLTTTTATSAPEWSVFSQVMQRDTPVGNEPGSLRLSRRAVSRASPFLDSPSVSEAGLGPNEEDTTYLSREISSPVSDPHLDLHFPPEADDLDTLDSRSSDESDGEHDHSPAETVRVDLSGKTEPWYSLSRLPTLSPLQRNILKCSTAYFLASLFTYSSYLSGFIATLTSDGPGEKYPSPSGHMVATVAVYFNPAKTLGGMVEADIYCLMGLGFAAIISLASMNIYWALETQPGWEWLADILALLWIGVGMSLLAWFKLWIAKPTFNPAASMTAIIIFVVVVKEGGLDTLLQVALIVAIGSLIANVVCLALWRQSAKANLQTNMIKTLDSYSTLLKLLTTTFLLEEPLQQPSQEKISKAVSDHQASFTKLKKDLAEARSERLCGGPSDGGGLTTLGIGRGTRRPYEDAVDSLTRLAQHLNGLRSGTSLQYDLAKAHRDGKVALKSRTLDAKGGKSRVKESIYAVPSKGKGSARDTPEEQTDEVLQAAAAMFGDLVDELGSPLKALSSTCTRAIRRLREAFAHSNHLADPDAPPNEFLELVMSIEKALHNFESTSNHALLRLYNRSDFSGAAPGSRGSIISLADSLLTNGGDNDNVFLVYFFIFTLQEFAEELVSLVDAMSRIYAIERENAKQGWWFKRTPLSLFGCLRSRSKSSTRPRKSLQRTLSSYLIAERKSPRIASSFPKVRPHAPDTVQTPSSAGLSFWRRFKLKLWALGGRMQDSDIKYAIKAGMATAMLASPAFFDATRPTFMEYRGEWALISFFVVMSPTIGATNFLSVHRVLGTLFGAVTAATVYSFFHEHASVLAIFGFFFSMPCFYYIVATPQYATTGRFVLLTYNLTCLYCYNIQHTDVSVVNIAFHRSASVTVGVVWAGFVSRFWWPSEARRELSKGLGEFCLNVGWLYTRLVASNSYSPGEPGLRVAPEDRGDETGDGDDGEASPTEQTSLIPRRAKTVLSNSIEEFMAMELHLQIKLIELQDLLKQTQHEPRLKGPFPVALYRSILTSLQTILDKLHSMRCVTTREEWITTVRRDFIVPVNLQRREMVGNIILYFSTLAAAFRLKAPLPPYLPPAEKARQQLVDAIRKLDVVKNRDIKGSRQLLFFAYALTMQGITRELDFLGRTLQDAFGVIGQSTEVFEAMFREQLAQA
ncbi:hypothetical protein FA95DRAFT_1558591 [Auriscalpium vulgare]|uniref:Uncharacterized protein n=1 Tax=Auriscalpium vulgare TaxID=40419 RepID=A0ACB8RVV9_9AGAM|nr:hypothetical protein FA95DRAFT_1558591 [Auriscalpium vulgare]